MKRQLAWLSVVLAAALLSLMGIALLRPYKPRSQQQEAPGASHVGSPDVLPPETADQGDPGRPRSSDADWRVAFSALLAEGIQLPDPGSVALELALSRQSIAPKRRHKLVRDSMGRVQALVTYEPTSWEESEFAVRTDIPPDMAGDAQAYSRVSSVLLEVAFLSGANRRSKEEVARNLVEILQAPETALGETLESQRLLQALRWQAAIALRRVPMSADQHLALHSMAFSHTDEVLRGALAGALLANGGDEQAAASWMKVERSPRALQAFLVELTRADGWSVYPASARVTVQREEGGSVELSSTESPANEARPVTAPGLFDALVTLLEETRGLDERETLKPSTEFSRAEGRLRMVQTPLEDMKSFIIAAMRLRVEPTNAGVLISLVRAEANTDYRVKLIEALALAKAEAALPELAAIANAPSPMPERHAAIDGLALNPHGRSVLEALLWNEDPETRARAARGLYLTDHKKMLSKEARGRLVELSQVGSDRTRSFFAQFVRWIEHHDQKTQKR